MIIEFYPVSMQSVQSPRCSSPIHSSHFILLNPIVWKYFLRGSALPKVQIQHTHGPYLNGRYGIGFDSWTSQSGSGGAVGLFHVDGVHSSPVSSTHAKIGKDKRTPELSVRFQFGRCAGLLLEIWRARSSGCLALLEDEEREADRDDAYQREKGNISDVIFAQREHVNGGHYPLVYEGHLLGPFACSQQHNLNNNNSGRFLNPKL